jgi:hypothetical protein
MPAITTGVNCRRIQLELDNMATPSESGPVSVRQPASKEGPVRSARFLKCAAEGNPLYQGRSFDPGKDYIVQSVCGRQAAAAGRGGSANLSAPFGLSTSLPASARASVFPYGFMLSTIELGIRIVAPRSLVVS